MIFKLAAIGLLTVALTAGTASPASAHEFYHHHHGFPIIGGLFRATGAVVTGAAEIATAPVRIIANAANPYPYAAPVYYAAPPAPVAYAYPPYGYPAPVTYAYPPQAYGYYR